MKPVKAPVVVFVVAGVVLAAALFFTVSLVTNFDTADVRPRAFGFPLLLWAVGIAAAALGIWQLGARRRYLAATTPQERAELEAAAKVAKSGGMSKPGEPLDYGSKVDERPEV